MGLQENRVKLRAGKCMNIVALLLQEGPLKYSIGKRYCVMGIRSNKYKNQGKYWQYTIAGLDQWTGPVDWTSRLEQIQCAPIHSHNTVPSMYCTHLQLNVK